MIICDTVCFKNSLYEFGGIRTKKPLDIIPFAQICTGGQNPLHGFARLDQTPFMILQGWTKPPADK